MMVVSISLISCGWNFNSNVPGVGDEAGDDGNPWATFFVGDAHVYSPECGAPSFTYCSEAYACDIDGQDIAAKLYDLDWQGAVSVNELHDFRMWKEAGAPPQDGLDYQYADKYNVAWYLGHANVGYMSFSEPHIGDPWSSPCVLGSPQVNLGIQGPGVGSDLGGHASVFMSVSSCTGYYGSNYDTQCVEKNWVNGVRQLLSFADSPVVSKRQAVDFIEELQKGKDNLSAWQDVMHLNHEQPFKENNPVVYTFATPEENQQVGIGTIADDANLLTGEWVEPPLPAAMNIMGIKAHSGSENLGNGLATCLPHAAPVPCP